MIHDAVAAYLGPAFTTLFRYILFPQRDHEDEGPLRLDVQPGAAPPLPLVGKVRLQIYKTRDVQVPWRMIGNAEPIADHSLSEPCIRLMRGWIDSCLSQREYHGNCAAEVVGDLPKRLIDVGRQEGDGIKLHLSIPGEKGNYVALSHCWGETMPITTTLKNVNQFIDGIPAPLPNTFTDAIHTTRALGIRFLWIDSLCIIQDSPEDWAEQAPRMADIYGKAYVTLSADAAGNCNEGFLSNSQRNYSTAVPVPWSSVVGNDKLWVRERGSLTHSLPLHGWEDIQPQCWLHMGQGHDNYDQDVQHTLRKICRQNHEVKSKLSTRAWVFQERALSPRTVFFGKGEIGWECRSRISCECSDGNMRHRRVPSLMKQAPHEMTWAWAEIVERFTRLNLTVPEDRLTALSGLAEARHSSTRQRYIAGMWEDQLKESLHWKWSATGVELRSYIAPSWSWASVACHIDADSSRRTQHGPDDMDIGDWSVLGVERRLAGPSPFGNWSPGSHLIMKGPLVPVEFIDKHGASFAPTEDNTTSPPQIWIAWDSKDREARAMKERNLASFVFFITTRGPRSPRGLLLKSYDGSGGSDLNPPGLIEVHLVSHRVGTQSAN
ncbi:hypothetical protein DL765_004518 [Monosporascus sp. GIB2]|nr:hypothetical protein DL765_004518 [Monosporascus sp. GIB2]